MRLREFVGTMRWLVVVGKNYFSDTRPMCVSLPQRRRRASGEYVEGVLIATIAKRVRPKALFRLAAPSTPALRNTSEAMKASRND